MEASIVIPLKSQQTSWLRNCILSALNQSTPCHVIVMTSEHTPSANIALLVELSRDYTSLSVHERQPGSAFALAINEGISVAETRRVGLLLSDDWLAPDAVSLCLEHEADIVCTGHRGMSADCGEELWERSLDSKVFEDLETLEKKASYLTHFFLFNRAALLAVGGVDPLVGLTGADDYDLPWTMLEQGASVALVGKPQYFYRDHTGPRLTLRDQQSQVADLRKIFAKHSIPEGQADQLIEEKRHWLGVPWHVAVNTPPDLEQD